MTHNLIEINTEIMFGKPVIRGTRMTVEQILRELSGGMNYDQIMEAHPRIKEEHIRAAIAFAADILANEDIQLVP